MTDIIHNFHSIHFFQMLFGYKSYTHKNISAIPNISKSSTYCTFDRASN